ncbi:YdiU family protein [Gemmata sp. JC717]|uniref:protein adenylyltransferase SelO n=1 Tax=Gemmata algarum TaxID=2975278 RepID=UPI0021BAD480|nr:YdiU family protein [Gemmata algarum]MDY3551225.1 YdiU family protein [Gemmata algarum]
MTTTAKYDGVGWRFDNTYTRLPDPLFVPTEPVKVRAPQVVVLNHGLARELGLDLGVCPEDAVASMFAGQELPTGSRPIAQAYAGHQYGGFTMLGDGRAILLGEHRAPDGRLVDIQFKGAGRTRFSRGGDGRAALGPMLREYVISEAMAGLGIPTTRSLAVVTTGEAVYRTEAQKGAVLTRVAASHIRVGTFEYAARRSPEALRELADYTIARHYPELADAPQKYLALFRAVSDRQAALVARWQLVGFIHGVMNTDNMAVSGETIDYGPCAFMNAYDPATVFSSIDTGGRYAYGNQPNIAQWNLARFAETLLALIDPDPETAVRVATEALNEFPVRFEAFWLAGMRKKLGLQTEQEGDAELVQSLLDWMLKSRADFTNTFRDLSSVEGLSLEPYRDVDFQAWYARWQERLGPTTGPAYELMRSVNPVVIPRNHRVEEALSAAEKRDDLAPLYRLLEAVGSPYVERADLAEYREPPADECGYRTFCGT